MFACMLFCAGRNGVVKILLVLVRILALNLYHYLHQVSQSMIICTARRRRYLQWLQGSLSSVLAVVERLWKG